MRQELTQDSVERYVEASPETLYDVIADVTRTPEFSPEIVSCEWIDGATGPRVGARFRAVNRVGRGRAWQNTPVVTVAEQGREFAFSRTEKGVGTIVWRYELAPVGRGTCVTESYEVTRPVTLFGWFIIGVVYGQKDRRGDLRSGMEQTLRRIGAYAESISTSP